jgi:hypothetical protein
MADFTEIVSGITSIGSLVSNILTSGDKVELAKYQAEIAKSNATAEEKKYALKLAQDRLDKIKADEEKAQKRKDIITYSVIGLGVFIVLGVAYYFLKPNPVPTVSEIQEAHIVEVPKPLALN